MGLGASGVQMVRTGELSSCVVNQYPDAAVAQIAQAKIAEIRDQVAQDLPLTMVSAHGGEVTGSP